MSVSRRLVPFWSEKSPEAVRAMLSVEISVLSADHELALLKGHGPGHREYAAELCATSPLRLRPELAALETRAELTPHVVPLFGSDGLPTPDLIVLGRVSFN
jgi:hypothetical protein